MSQIERSLVGRPLILRADASPSIGTGHLMRLLALGQAWRDRGGQAHLLVAEAPEALLDRYAGEGIAVESLRAPHPDPMDAERLAQILETSPEALGVVDGPAFDMLYADELGSNADRIMMVDDLAAWPRYPVGFVLNQNAHAHRARYPVGDGPIYMLGLSYVLLRREFRGGAPERPIPRVARRLLVTFGGADPAGMVLRAIVALGSLPVRIARGLEVRVIIGAANPAAAAIEAAAARCPVRVDTERRVSDMGVQLAWADLAIVSGGTTVWELARMGCPAIVVEAGPTEPALVEGLARLGLFERLGPASDLSNEALASAISTRAIDPEWRRTMAEMGPRLVDGQGADRVIDVLVGGGSGSETAA